ncbi:hypothetical protein GCK32_006127 [Trichostrongylus colubriformis]|uniref:Secreted protein n=1 Tax=Trichostrongylus colubriformis TaxID=6319 RepID=A0AAN8EWQ3_TRICO
MVPASSTTAIVALSLLVSIGLLHELVSAGSVTCNAADYCPNGWNVLRKANYDATTCDPMAGIKCEIPYQCVHSHCGMSFCCADTKRLKKWLEYKEMEADMDDDLREDL